MTSVIFHVKRAKLNAYVDDHLQVYNRPSGSRGMRMLQCRRVAKEWYHLWEWGMLQFDDSMRQALVLSDTDNGFPSQ